MIAAPPQAQERRCPVRPCNGLLLRYWEDAGALVVQLKCGRCKQIHEVRLPR